MMKRDRILDVCMAGMIGGAGICVLILSIRVGMGLLFPYPEMMKEFKRTWDLMHPIDQWQASVSLFVLEYGAAVGLVIAAMGFVTWWLLGDERNGESQNPSGQVPVVSLQKARKQRANSQR